MICFCLLHKKAITPQAFQGVAGQQGIREMEPKKPAAENDNISTNHKHTCGAWRETDVVLVPIPAPTPRPTEVDPVLDPSLSVTRFPSRLAKNKIWNCRDRSSANLRPQLCYHSCGSWNKISSRSVAYPPATRQLSRERHQGPLEPSIAAFLFVGPVYRHQQALESSSSTKTESHVMNRVFSSNCSVNS